MTDWHVGRSFSTLGVPYSGVLEEGCPCPKEQCGMVSRERVVPACREHPFTRLKAMRSAHPAEVCPGRYTCREPDCERGPGWTGDVLFRTSPQGEPFEGACREHFPGEPEPPVHAEGIRIVMPDLGGPDGSWRDGRGAGPRD